MEKKCQELIQEFSESFKRGFIGEIMNRVEKIKAMLEEVDYEEIFLEREKRESAYVKGLRNKSITKKDILILNSEYEFAKIIEDAYGILLNAKQIDREIDTE